MTALITVLMLTGILSLVFAIGAWCADVALPALFLALGRVLPPSPLVGHGPGVQGATSRRLARWLEED